MNMKNDHSLRSGEINLASPIKNFESIKITISYNNEINEDKFDCSLEIIMRNQSLKFFRKCFKQMRD